MKNAYTALMSQPIDISTTDFVIPDDLTASIITCTTSGKFFYDNGDGTIQRADIFAGVPFSVRYKKVFKTGTTASGMTYHVTGHFSV